MNVNIIIGGAGFIGANLSRFLADLNEIVAVIDDFSLGRRQNISFLPDDCIWEADATNLNSLKRAFIEIRRRFGSENVTVWHLAANSDIQAGTQNSLVDFEKTLKSTFTILELMNEFGIGQICFASSSAVYGDKGRKSIGELEADLQPISNYGACKLASEALISAARESHLKDVSIFRFPNVVGFPATHGVIYDFIKKLMVNQSQLNVLGDGTQQKSYLHVSDLVDAMYLIKNFRSMDRLKIFNIGPADDGITVAEIARLTVEHIDEGASIIFGSEARGWVGDIPRFNYDINKIKSLGWLPRLNSREAICLAIREVKEQLYDNH